ncbi:MAG: hypothetical protein H0W61_13190 [Bacteroidetes bacterium]|nr:hypothetical protein [Bacteroidota bacterium]
MENINLNIITEDHVAGKWEVKQRVVRTSNEKSPFTTSQHIEIENGIYKSNNGKECTGKLIVVREEIIFNTQLKFYENDAEVANAIITRLYSEDDGNEKIYHLTLYFTTGLELVLQKIN